MIMTLSRLWLILIFSDLTKSEFLRDGLLRDWDQIETGAIDPIFLRENGKNFDQTDTFRPVQDDPLECQTRPCLPTASKVNRRRRKLSEIEADDKSQQKIAKFTIRLPRPGRNTVPDIIKSDHVLTEDRKSSVDVMDYSLPKVESSLRRKPRTTVGRKKNKNTSTQKPTPNVLDSASFNSRREKYTGYRTPSQQNANRRLSGADHSRMNSIGPQQLTANKFSLVESDSIGARIMKSIRLLPGKEEEKPPSDHLRVSQSQIRQIEPYLDSARVAKNHPREQNLVSKDDRSRYLISNHEDDVPGDDLDSLLDLFPESEGEDNGSRIHNYDVLEGQRVDVDDEKTSSNKNPDSGLRRSKSSPQSSSSDSLFVSNPSSSQFGTHEVASHSSLPGEGNLKDSPIHISDSSSSDSSIDSGRSFSPFRRLKLTGLGDDNYDLDTVMSRWRNFPPSPEHHTENTLPEGLTHSAPSPEHHTEKTFPEGLTHFNPNHDGAEEGNDWVQHLFKLYSNQNFQHENLKSEELHTGRDEETSPKTPNSYLNSEPEKSEHQNIVAFTSQYDHLAHLPGKSVQDVSGRRSPVQSVTQSPGHNNVREAGHGTVTETLDHKELALGGGIRGARTDGLTSEVSLPQSISRVFSAEITTPRPSTSQGLKEEATTPQRVAYEGFKDLPEQSKELHTGTDEATSPKTSNSHPNSEPEISEHTNIVGFNSEYDQPAHLPGTNIQDGSERPSPPKSVTQSPEQNHVRDAGPGTVTETLDHKELALGDDNRGARTDDLTSERSLPQSISRVLSTEITTPRPSTSKNLKEEATTPETFTYKDFDLPELDRIIWREKEGETPQPIKFDDRYSPPKEDQGMRYHSDARQLDSEKKLIDQDFWGAPKDVSPTQRLRLKSEWRFPSPVRTDTPPRFIEDHSTHSTFLSSERETAHSSPPRVVRTDTFPRYIGDHSTHADITRQPNNPKPRPVVPAQIQRSASMNSATQEIRKPYHPRETNISKVLRQIYERARSVGMTEFRFMPEEHRFIKQWKDARPTKQWRDAWRYFRLEVTNKGQDYDAIWVGALKLHYEQFDLTQNWLNQKRKMSRSVYDFAKMIHVHEEWPTFHSTSAKDFESAIELLGRLTEDEDKELHGLIFHEKLTNRLSWMAYMSGKPPSLKFYSEKAIKREMMSGLDMRMVLKIEDAMIAAEETKDGSNLSVEKHAWKVWDAFSKLTSAFMADFDFYDAGKIPQKYHHLDESHEWRVRYERFRFTSKPLDNSEPPPTYERFQQGMETLLTSLQKVDRIDPQQFNSWTITNCVTDLPSWSPADIILGLNYGMLIKDFRLSQSLADPFQEPGIYPIVYSRWVPRPRLEHSLAFIQDRQERVRTGRWISHTPLGQWAKFVGYLSNRQRNSLISDKMTEAVDESNDRIKEIWSRVRSDPLQEPVYKENTIFQDKEKQWKDEIRKQRQIYNTRPPQATPAKKVPIRSSQVHQWKDKFRGDDEGGPWKRRRPA